MDDTEKLVQMMIRCGLATGHGDTIDDLIFELEKQIKNTRLANSDLQMWYDYAKNECDKLQTEVLRLRGSLSFISMLTPLDGQSWESHARFINAYAVDQLEEEE